MNASRIKKGLIFLVLVALNSFIVQAALADTFRGLTSGIGNFFHWKVIGSAVIIIGAAYFALPLFGQKLQTPQGKTAALLIISIVAIFIVIQPLIGKTYDDATYKALWEKDLFVKLKDVLIGQKNANVHIDNGELSIGGSGRAVTGYINEDGKPRVALLTADGLIILVVGTLLFAWFFDFLKVTEGKPVLNYALAVVIAADLAVNGYTTDALINLGVVFAFFIFAKSISATVKTPQRAYALSGILVIWVHKVLTGRWIPFISGEASGSAAEVGWWGSITGTAKGAGGLAIIGLIVLIAFLWKKGADGEGKLKGLLRGDPLVYGLQKLKAWARGIWLLQKLGIAKLQALKQKSPEGEVPFVFRDLRVELETLMNYMLRLEVYTNKHHTVENAIKSVVGEIGKVLSGTEYLGAVQRDLDKYKNGTGVQKEKNGYFNQAYKLFYYEKRPGEIVKDENGPQKVAGFAGGRWLVCNYLFNELKKALETDLSKPAGNKEDEIRKKIETISGTFKDELGIMTKWSDAYKKSVERYGVIHRRRSLMSTMLDQYLMTGKYEHYYRFAKPGAAILEYPRRDGKVVWGEGRVAGNVQEKGGVLPEVTLNGLFIEDWNAIEVEGKSLPSIRGVDIKDIYMPVSETGFTKENLKIGPQAIVDWIEKEWFYFIQDILDGRFHPRSKAVSQYIRAHAEGNWKYRNLAPYGTPDRNNPAFDREALKDPGKFVYWGRKKYYDELPSEINQDPVNPYPGVSALGLAMYINDIAKKIEKNTESIQQFLKLYVYPTGEEENEVFKKTVEEKHT